MPRKIPAFVNAADRASGIREALVADNVGMDSRLRQSFSSLLRVLAPSAATRLANQMDERLRAGEAFGAALKAVLPALAREAVEDAASRFEGGAVALFIVDLRDVLRHTLESAGRKLSRRHLGTGAFLARRMGDVSAALVDEQVEQHLINCVLSVTGLYAEAMTLELGRLDREKLAGALADVLRQLVGATLPRAQQVQTLDSLGAGYALGDRLAKA